MINISGISGAVFDRDKIYRYLLWRWLNKEDQGGLWPMSISTVTFVMLNPSTADASKDDPTIRRCLGFARTWGFSRLLVVNLFAFRSSSPKELKKHLKSFDGQLEGVTFHGYNDEWIEFAARKSNLMVLAWSANLPEECESRKEEIEQIIERMEPKAPVVKCLGLTKYGAPRHPLYAPKDAKLIDWRW